MINKLLVSEAEAVLNVWGQAAWDTSTAARAAKKKEKSASVTKDGPGSGTTRRLKKLGLSRKVYDLAKPDLFSKTGDVIGKVGDAVTKGVSKVVDFFKK